MKLEKTLTRGYYIMAVIILEPIWFFKRKIILQNLKKDWEFGNTKWKQFQKKRLKVVLDSYKKISSKKEKHQKQISHITLKDFPTISKKDIYINPHNFINNNILIPHSQKNTGGSTGEPLKFFITFYNRQLEYIHQKFFYERLGYKFGDLIYSFGGCKITELEKKNNIFWQKNIKNFPFGKLTFSAVDLNDNNAIHYIDKILKEKPSFLRGYPSAIEMIAKNVSRLKCSDKFDFLKGVMLTSENIYSSQIFLINKVLNCPVVPQYGMTESSVFAFANQNELKYYCSPYYGITEVLNSNGDHVKVGEIGELVLTSLGNNFQPFVRYKSGDMAVYGGQINGFTILEEILGRTQDFIVDENGEKLLLVGLIFGAHLKSFEKIKTWQIIQNEIGKIELRIDPSENWSLRNEKEIIDNFEGKQKIKVNLHYTSEFILTSAGKRKFVIQHL